MQITHVITSIARGGAENQLLILCRQLVKENHKVKVLALKGEPELNNLFISSGIDVRLCESTNLINQIFFVRRNLPNNKHILHAHLPQAELVAKLAARRFSIRVATRHFGGDFYPDRPKLLSRALSRFSTRGVSGIIAISDSVKSHLIQSREIAKRVRLVRIYYGFSETEFIETSGSGQSLSALVFPAGSYKRVGTIARLSPEKDLSTLLLAFAESLGHDANQKLFIAGSGPLKDELMDLGKSLGIDSKIFFVGRISEVYSFLKELDVFVLTSKFEGFGMVLLEAMAARVRIIAARNSAILEVLGNSGAGTFFETSTKEDLANKLNRSNLASPEDWQNQQAKRLEFFSAINVSKSTLKFYAEIF